MIDLFANKESLLRIKPQLFKWLFSLIIILIIIVIIFLVKWQTYDNYKTKGIVECNTECYLITTVLTDEEYLFLKINSQTYDFNLIAKELIVDEEEYISYYVYTLDIDEDFTNQEILDINFYYHKQSILKKLVSSILMKEV